MRRKDREKDANWALDVMRKAPYITVSFSRTDGSAYGVPLSLAEWNGNWYFHCAKTGEKMNAIAAHPDVCLSAVAEHTPHFEAEKGNFTMLFRSAVAFGRAEVVSDEAEKTEALRAICERFLPERMNGFDAAVERSLHHTAVVRITLSVPPTGKAKETK